MRLCFLCVVLCLQACSAEQAFRRDLAHSAGTQIDMRVETDMSFTQSPPLVMSAMIKALRSRSAEIIYYDFDAGVVLWRDLGVSSRQVGTDSGINLIDAGTGKHHHAPIKPYIIGFARLVPWKWKSQAGGANAREIDCAWLCIRSFGVDREILSVVSSDGSYERTLLSSIAAHVRRFASGLDQLPVDTPGVYQNDNLIRQVAPAAYHLSPQTLVGQTTPVDKVESRPPDEVWSALVSVCMYSGMIIKMDHANRLLVLRTERAVRLDADQNDPPPSEDAADSSAGKEDQELIVRVERQTVLLGAHINPQGGLYLAYLNQDGKWVRPPKHKMRNQDDVWRVIEGTSPLDIAAAMVCQPIPNQLAMQLELESLRPILTRGRDSGAGSLELE